MLKKGEISFSKIRDICKIFENSENSQILKEGSGLMSGLAGISLFLFYSARVLNNKHIFELANVYLSKSFERINDSNVNLSFCNGISGLCWTVEHLKKYDYITTNTAKILVDADNLLNEFINNNKTFKFDFLHGEIGIGYYLLYKKRTSIIKRSIESIINKLEETSVIENDGSYKWMSVVKGNNNDYMNVYNLSISHGISSIIIFLAKCIQKYPEIETTSVLLNGAIKFLLKSKICENKNAHSIFPSWVNEEDHDKSSRIGWCYGDLGNGIALLHSYQALKKEELLSEAIKIFEFNAYRQKLREESINDGCLCHGTAGIMQIFERVYQYTRCEIFRNTANFWLDKTISISNHPEGLAGYKTWTGESNTGWANKYNLLDGVAGIGLGLITMISVEDLYWDEFLLLS